MVLGNSILIPVLPNIEDTLRLTPAASGLIISAFSVPAGLLIPVAGFLADRYGRKAVMAPGLAIFALGGFISAAAAFISTSAAFGLLMAGRVVQGVGAAGTANIALALAGDLYKGAARGQSLGVLEASNGLGKVVSPILGAALGLVAWVAPFIFFSVVTLPVVAAVAIWVRDVKPGARSSARQYLGSILKVFSRKGSALGAAFFAGLAALLLLFGTLFYLSETLERVYHVEGVMKGLLLAIPVLASSIMAYVAGAHLPARIGRRYLVAGGLVLMSLSLAALAVVSRPYLVYAAVFLVGAGSGTVLANLDVLVTGSVERDRRAMITSDYGAVRFFGVALGPPLFGLVMGQGNVILFAGAAALGAAAAVLAWFFVRPERLLVSGSEGNAGPG